MTQFKTTLPFLLLPLLARQILAQDSSVTGSLDEGTSSSSSSEDSSTVDSTSSNDQVADESTDSTETQQEDVATEAIATEAIATQEALTQEAVTAAVTDVAASAAGYAVQPSTTIVTTNAQGQTTTQYLWYIPPTEASVANSIVNSNIESTVATATEVTASGSIAPVSITTRTTDGPLTTVTGTYSNGIAYTSTLWWLPSSEMAKLTASGTTTLEGSSASISDSISATSHHSSTSKSTSTTHSIHSYTNSTNAGYKLNQGSENYYPVVGGLAALLLL